MLSKSSHRVHWKRVSVVLGLLNSPVHLITRDNVSLLQGFDGVELSRLLKLSQQDLHAENIHNQSERDGHRPSELT